jgi:PQQ-dependent dehydrogenase (methanol/ethanol family)
MRNHATNVYGSLALLAVSAIFSVVLSSCQKPSTSASTTTLTPQVATPQQAVQVVNDRRLSDADNDSSNWLTHGRTYNEQRFSPLEQITADNVAGLKLAWSFDLPATERGSERGQESTPLVVDGTMYVSLSWSRVLALDAMTGAPRWQYDPKVPGEWGINACCDVVNRGVAFWEGKVYIGTLDGRLVALDAMSGKPLWETLVIDRSERASITGAPRVIKGRVYIGSAGGEFGVRGRLTALDANTGALLWRFFTVPGEADAPADALHTLDIRSSWNGAALKQGGGGAVWDAISYDPVLDLLYIGTGNGSPWPQSLRSAKGGDNLFVSSILALKADTGELVWHYQTTPGDEWGFDAASQLVLAELGMGGKLRSVLIQAAANGFIYVLDRATGQLLSATAFVPVNWAKSVNLSTGRPIENPAARYSKTGKPFDSQPAPRGAHSWHPLSFDPRTGLLYVPAMINTARLSLEKPSSTSRYTLTTGTTVRQTPGAPPDSSRLIAWDPALGKAIWSLDRSTPTASGVLATAGNLVFQGSLEGSLEAIQADTGKVLWQAKTGASIAAAPISYQVGEVQLLAVVAGAGGKDMLQGGAQISALAPQTNTPRILAYSLQGTATLKDEAPQPPASSGADRILSAATTSASAATSASTPASLPEPFSQPSQLRHGEALYATFCARCHGEGTLGAGPLESLTKSKRLGDASAWQLVVHAGQFTASGMPGFLAELTSADAEDIRAFVVQQAWREGPPP